MKVQCPKCSIGYNIDEKKLPVKGAYVRCRKCQHRFFIKKEEPAEAAGKTIECPKCKLPQKGINECEYCGFVFEEKLKTKESIRSENSEKDSFTNCRFCKARIPKNAESCPHCGKLQIIKTKKIVWIGIVAFIILFSLVIPYYLEQSKERPQKFSNQDKDRPKTEIKPTSTFKEQSKEKRIQLKPENQIKYAEIPSFKVIKNEDVNNLRVNIKRIRTLLVEKKLTKAQLKALLVSYEEIIRQEIKSKKAKYKIIIVWVYDDLYRANAGLGEWVGMISNRAEAGKLSDSPEISLRVKGPEILSPTQRENQISDSLQKALWKDPNVPEEIIMKDIAKQFNITVEELKDIYAKVFEYRHK